MTSRLSHANNCRLDSLCESGLSRRKFFRNSAATAAAAAAGVSISFAPQAAHAGAADTKTLVYIFLRGAMDGLSFVVPINDNANAQIYRAKRPSIGLNINDTNSVNRPLPLTGGLFGLHPSASGLKSLWDLDKLAIVHACGHSVPSTYTRSHFDSQEQIELGTPGAQGAGTGWLARHLITTPDLVDTAVFNALASGGTPPQSLQGWSDAVTLSSTGSFHPDSGGTFARTHLASLKSMYAGNTELDTAAQAALSAVDLVSGINFGAYVPGGGVTYPNNGLGNALKLIATLMRQNIGLSAATLDTGGWDTHNGQGTKQFGGYFNNVFDLSQAVTAFYKDLAAAGFGNRVAIVMQSEFGRQVTENESQGTDHGLGNPMFVIGGAVNGGFYGNFPGLASLEGDAVRPTMDFRQVLATVVAGLMGNPHVEEIFDDADAPPFTYSPVGFA